MYLYIGSYQPVFGQDLLELENIHYIKKIGFTEDLESRKSSLTRDFLSFEYLKVWEIPNKAIEKAIHNLLSGRIEKTEWFLDLDNNLVDKLSKSLSTSAFGECKVCNDIDDIKYKLNPDHKEHQKVKESLINDIKKDKRYEDMKLDGKKIIILRGIKKKYEGISKDDLYTDMRCSWVATFKDAKYAILLNNNILYACYEITNVSSLSDDAKRREFTGTETNLFESLEGKEYKVFPKGLGSHTSLDFSSI